MTMNNKKITVSIKNGAWDIMEVTVDSPIDLTEDEVRQMIQQALFKIMSDIIYK